MGVHAAGSRSPARKAGTIATRARRCQREKNRAATGPFSPYDDRRIPAPARSHARGAVRTPLPAPHRGPGRQIDFAPLPPDPGGHGGRRNPPRDGASSKARTCCAPQPQHAGPGGGNPPRRGLPRRLARPWGRASRRLPRAGRRAGFRQFRHRGSALPWGPWRRRPITATFTGDASLCPPAHGPGARATLPLRRPRPPAPHRGPSAAHPAPARAVPIPALSPYESRRSPRPR